MSRLSLRERLARMNQRSLFHPAAPAPAAAELAVTDLARAEAVQRVQVGLFGIGAMVLLVGLASIIGGQVEKTERLAVPEAVPTTEPAAPPAQANPLADAGVVPDIAPQPSAPASAAPGRAGGNGANGQ